MKKVNLCEVNKNEMLTSKELHLIKGGEEGGGGTTYCNILGCHCCCCGCEPKATDKAAKCRCTDRAAS